MINSETETQVLYNWLLTNEFAGISMGKFNNIEGELASSFYIGNNGDFFRLEGISTTTVRLDTSAKKLFDYSCICLSQINSYGATKNLKNQVKFSLEDYARRTNHDIFVRDLTDSNKESKRIRDAKSNLKKQMKKDLEDIKQLTWTGHVVKGRNKGEYDNIRLILSYSIVQDYVTIIFDVCFVRFLTNAYVMQFPMCLLKHDNHKSNAYSIGRKLALHFNINRGKNNATIISVYSLLCEAPGIPSKEELANWGVRGQRNWREKIKNALEKALNDNISIGLIKKWIYKGTGGYVYESVEANIFDWDVWISLMVFFDPTESWAKAVTKPSECRGSEEPLSR